MNVCIMQIPLIQTFGHMEFLLKHEKWYNLREVERYPSSICPSHPDTLSVIKKMLDQVILFHKNIEYIHIGLCILFTYYLSLFLLNCFL